MVEVVLVFIDTEVVDGENIPYSEIRRIEFDDREAAEKWYGGIFDPEARVVCSENLSAKAEELNEATADRDNGTGF